MKLKFELVNGFGVLIDETGKSKSDWFLENGELSRYWSHTSWVFADAPKILFAEKELNLEGVPVFEWREIVIFQKANLWFDKMEKQGKIAYPPSFIDGYKSNQAKHTDEDLRKAIQFGQDLCDVESFEPIPDKEIDKFIQSLQKYPKWVVMESEEVEVPYFDESGSSKISGFKLFTNSEKKQQGIIKELVWT